MEHWICEISRQLLRDENFSLVQNYVIKNIIKYSSKKIFHFVCVLKEKNGSVIITIIFTIIIITIILIIYYNFNYF